MVIVTSPALQHSLIERRVNPEKIKILPCSLDAVYERELLSICRSPKTFNRELVKVIFVGRLDSYKRLDWLIDCLRNTTIPWHLDVVGDGPRREFFESYSKHDPITFHGLIDEATKLKLLRQASLCCLISDKCNEAFGIVQIEAMASGIPSLALNLKDSGMYWVSKTPSLPWSGNLVDLSAALETLYLNPTLFNQCSIEARSRYLDMFSRDCWIQSLSSLSTPQKSS